MMGTGGRAGTGGAASTGGAPGTGGVAGAGGATANCVKALFGRYLVRTDGAVLYEGAPPNSSDQTPVLDDSTGLPLLGVTEVHDGSFYGCAVQESSGSAWCWRTEANGNQYGQLGNGTIDRLATAWRATRVLIAAGQPLTNVVSISNGETPNPEDSAACAVTGDGKVYCWGSVAYLVSGGSPITLTSPFAVPITTDGVTPLGGVLQVAVSAYQSSRGNACAVVRGASSRELWCWGSNGRSSLGLGDLGIRRYPTKVSGVDNPIKVLTHDYYGGTTCVLDGSNVRCWGYTYMGETGTGIAQPDDVTRPALVISMADMTPFGDVVDLHGGDNVTATFCALTASKTVFCWGRGYKAYPTDLGVTDVVLLGGTGLHVRYLSGDGMYHFVQEGAFVGSIGSLRAPNCGPFP